MYTVKQLAKLSGVTPRTLRYYDQIGLLKPSYINDSGYRIYEQEAVDRLQQILFFREFDLSLAQISKIIDSQEYQAADVLEEQYHQLLSKREDLDKLIEETQKALAYYKGEIQMTDQEKFHRFKKERVAKNEEQFGQEVRQKYGETVIEQSNQKLMGMSESVFQSMQETEKELFAKLEVLSKVDIDTALGKEIYLLHKKWLNYSWNSYSVEAHKGVADLYIADQRFTEYYEEQAGVGKTKLLREVIYYWA